MPRKFNSANGVPIFDAEEKSFLHADMISRPCKACGAKPGRPCVRDDKSRMPAGTVHMGRLPDGYDTLKVIEGRNTKKKRG